MKEFIKTVASIVNQIHNYLSSVFLAPNPNLSDKDLHFLVMGIIGMFIFFFVYIFFKLLENVKWNTTIYSFVYTFTVMVVIVFAIEIEQAMTGGDMEFMDAVVGLWGFVVLFLVYAAIALIIYFTAMYIKHRKANKQQQDK